MSYYGNSHDHYAAHGRLLDEPEDDGEEYCPVCGGYMEWVRCWNMCDEGEFDLYDMNPNEYEPGDVLKCAECAGEGGYLECTNLPHSEVKP